MPLLAGTGIQTLGGDSCTGERLGGGPSAGSSGTGSRVSLEMTSVPARANTATTAMGTSVPPVCSCMVSIRIGPTMLPMP